MDNNDNYSMSRQRKLQCRERIDYVLYETLIIFTGMDYIDIACLLPVRFIPQ